MNSRHRAASSKRLGRNACAGRIGLAAVLLLAPGTCWATAQDDREDVYRSHVIRLGELTIDPATAAGEGRFKMDVPPAGKAVHWLIQLVSPPDAAERERLARTYGLTFRQPVSETTFIERLDVTQVQALAGQEVDLYRAHLRYHPSFKSSEGSLPRLQFDALVDARVFMFLEPDLVELSTRLGQMGAESVEVIETGKTSDSRLMPRLHVRLPGRRLADLQSLEDVRWIEIIPDRVLDFGLPIDRDLNAMPEGRVAELSISGEQEEDPLWLMDGPERYVETGIARQTTVTIPVVRNWIEVDTEAGWFADSNPLLLGKTFEQNALIDDGTFFGRQSVGYRRTHMNLSYVEGSEIRTRLADALFRRWELGGSVSATGTHQDEVSAAGRTEVGATGFLDFELGRPGSDKQYSVGFKLDYNTVRLEEHDFFSSVKLTAAGVVSFDRAGDCDLDRLTLFASFEDFDDEQTLARREFDRTGHNQAVGITYSISPGKKPVDWYCIGGGTFREPSFDRRATMRFSYEHTRDRTHGSEFRRHADRYVVRARVGIPKRPKRAGAFRRSAGQVEPRVVIDGRVATFIQDYSTESFFTSARHQDRSVLAGLGVTFPLRQESEYLKWTLDADNRVYPLTYHDLSLRLGALLVDQNSPVPEYDVERTIYSVTFRYAFGKQSHRNAATGDLVKFENERYVPDTDVPGSISGSGSGAGPDRPKVGFRLITSRFGL